MGPGYFFRVRPVMRDDNGHLERFGLNFWMLFSCNFLMFKSGQKFSVLWFRLI